MKKENKNLERCAFCGKLTNYYFGELACFICPTCLGEYKKASSSTTVVKCDDWSTNKNIFTYIDKTTATCF